MTETPSTVEHVDPASLLVDVNIRTHTNLDKDFLASIRELGVLVPIVAARTPDGALRVRFGHRRTLAAVEAGRPTVPVVVLPDPDTTDPNDSGRAGEAARIVAQWHENEQRAGLSTGDKVAAVEQLSLLGLSAAQIVRHTKAPKAEVAAALAASGSDLAKGAADRYQFLTLDAAAAVAEFESDPAVVKTLVVAAKRSEGDFTHVLQRARDDRDEAVLVAELVQRLTGEGTRIVERPDYDDKTIKRVTSLLDAHDKPLTVKGHAACPGHAAYVHKTWQGVEAVHVCTDWRTHGHRDPNSTARAAGAMSESEKAERREIVTRNKEWKSATVVRRDWLATFLARKTPAKGSAVYVASELARGSHQLRRAMERSPELAATLLGTDASHSRQSVTTLADTATSDARAQVIALGVVLGAVEDGNDVHTWRNPNDAVTRYFAFLAANGYVLTEVEQLAAGALKKTKQRGPRTPRNAKPTPTVTATATATESPDTEPVPDESTPVETADTSGEDTDPVETAEADEHAAA